MEFDDSPDSSRTVLIRIGGLTTGVNKKEMGLTKVVFTDNTAFLAERTKTGYYLMANANFQPTLSEMGWIKNLKVAFLFLPIMDDDDDPIGGRSVVELGLEARIKVTDTIGIVPFLDAGQVYETPWPQGENLQYAAGLGLRYYTAFGPRWGGCSLLTDFRRLARWRCRTGRSCRRLSFC